LLAVFHEILLRYPQCHSPRAHARGNAERVHVLPDSPNEFYQWLHGPGEVIELRVVPDRAAALLLEVEGTCALAAATRSLVPGPARCARRESGYQPRPWWSKNWCNRRVADGALQWLYSMREFIRTAYARATA
jgi:hypothetical protein